MELETLHKWKEGAKIFALIAVPIIVAVVPVVLQNHASQEAAQESARKDYVTLAVGILSRKKEDQPDLEVRQWAVQIVDKESPVPLPQSLQRKLGMGDISLSSWEFSDFNDFRTRIHAALEEAQKTQGAANPPAEKAQQKK